MVAARPKLNATINASPNASRWRASRSTGRRNRQARQPAARRRNSGGVARVVCVVVGSRASWPWPWSLWWWWWSWWWWSCPPALPERTRRRRTQLHATTRAGRTGQPGTQPLWNDDRRQSGSPGRSPPYSGRPIAERGVPQRRPPAAQATEAGPLARPRPCVTERDQRRRGGTDRRAADRSTPRALRHGRRHRRAEPSGRRGRAWQASRGGANGERRARGRADTRSSSADSSMGRTTDVLRPSRAAVISRHPIRLTKVLSLKASAVPWSDATNTASNRSVGRPPAPLRSEIRCATGRSAVRSPPSVSSRSRTTSPAYPGARTRSPDWNVGISARSRT